MTKNKTQCELIIEHIVERGHITQRDAFIDYGIQSFHRRLSDLKEMGFEITSVSAKHPVTGQEYSRYSLAEGSVMPKVLGWEGP